MLTWCGFCVVEAPYVGLSQIFRILYFLTLVVFVVGKGFVA